jgi:hypothetical protein
VAVNSVKRAFIRILRFPNDCLFALTRDGGWKLRHPTDVIINHFIDSRNQSDAAKLRDQLSQPFVQRWWIKGRINPIFHYLLDPDSLLDGEEYQNSLFRIELVVDGKKQHANITFGGGRIYSVELPKPIKLYKGKDLQFGAVTRGNNRQSMTRAIDRLEHGKDFEG